MGGVVGVNKEEVLGVGFGGGGGVGDVRSDLVLMCLVIYWMEVVERGGDELVRMFMV